MGERPGAADGALGPPAVFDAAPATTMRAGKQIGGARGIAAALCAIGLAILIMGCNIQYQFLYYPSNYVPSEKFLAAHGLQFWPAAGEGFRGFIAKTAGAGPQGTIIIFHGNAGTAAERYFYADVLGPLGYRIILAEYPRYGGRGGKLGEESFVSDAIETVRIASEKYGGKIFLMGESMGCAVVAAVAGKSGIPVAGLILATPWDTLLSVAEMRMSLLPVKLIMKDKYDSVTNLKSFRGEVAIIGAEKDDIVPIRLAENLYNSLSGPKKMWVVWGAGHNDWQMYLDRNAWKEIMSYIDYE